MSCGVILGWFWLWNGGLDCWRLGDEMGVNWKAVGGLDQMERKRKKSCRIQRRKEEDCSLDALTHSGCSLWVTKGAGSRS